MERHPLLRTTLTVLVSLVAMIAISALPASADHASTGTFAGPKANSGHAIFHKDGAKRTISVSDDFVVPDTPDPHFRVVDSRGNVYELARLPLKDGKVNRTVEVPAYVKDVQKVQIWCAFAEVVLGEASFDAPVN